MSTRENILNAIATFVAEHGCAPTEIEIADALGMSKSNVRYHIGKLREAGKLKRIHAGGRSLALVESSTQLNK